MKSLREGNPYLADPQLRKTILYDNARQSSIFAGAQGIPAQPIERSRRWCFKTSPKKAVKGSSS
jgi:hypothetical protein